MHNFLKNVYYIKHFRLFLHPITYKYGKEYIRKDNAKSIEPELEDNGRTDYAGTQAEASIYAGHSRQGYGHTTDCF